MQIKELKRSHRCSGCEASFPGRLRELGSLPMPQPPVPDLRPQVQEARFPLVTALPYAPGSLRVPRERLIRASALTTEPAGDWRRSHRRLAKQIPQLPGAAEVTRP